MSEQQRTDARAESDGDATQSDMTMQHQGRRISERRFTQDVIDVAESNGWRTYHLRDRDSIHIVRGRGFPDLVMFRKDEKTGATEFVVAELKRGDDSELRPEQKEWFCAFKAQLPTYEWRPRNWDEIESVMKDGPKKSESADQTQRLQIESRRIDSPFPANFVSTMSNLVETIEDKDFDRGNHARLRRMDPDNPDTAIFWKFMSWRTMPRNPDTKKWGLIMHGIALMSHKGLAHNSGMPVGRALFYGGDNSRDRAYYSEERLATLLAARGDTLRRLLVRLFRMMGNEGRSFDWFEMARFILNDGHDEERSEQARTEIARAYYRAKSRSERPNSQK